MPQRQAEQAARRACELSEAGYNVWHCAHLLTQRRRVKENAATITALYVDGDAIRFMPSIVPRADRLGVSVTPVWGPRSKGKILLASKKPASERDEEAIFLAIPEDWIGQHISLGTDLGPSATIMGTLEEVSDRGVVVEHDLADEEGGEVCVFYPWRIVLWLYPREEQGRERRRPRPTGMAAEIVTGYRPRDAGLN